MGIPVLLGVRGESAEIVQSDGVGIVFEPENAGELVQSLVRLGSDSALLAQYRARCIASAPRYDRSVLASAMLHTLETAVEARRETLDRTQMSGNRRP